MVSINRLNQGQRKDMAANIVRTGEFLVHMTDEAIA
jgi:flavin reductase (DIM6/NTAB) family NADH-FMN oxidoreductase RutF